MWEKIKAEKKAEKLAAWLARALNPEDHGMCFLDSIPVSLLASTRAQKLPEKAARVSFNWGEAASILERIEEEISELRDSMAKYDQVSVK